MEKAFVSWVRSCALAGVVAAGMAWAQSSSVFVGTVRDALTKEVVPDVIVLVTSPEKLGEEIALTDGTGSYRILQLPPGTYKLRFEKEGYRVFERQDIALDSHKTLRINIELAPLAIEAPEEIITGQTPAIDIGSGTLGVVANERFVQHVPMTAPGYMSGTTSFAAVANTAPGVQGDLVGFSIAGTTSPENAVFIDGLSVSNPHMGGVGTPLSAEFMRDVSVLTGGFMPEYGRTTGGIISGVTKSGSNTLHGSVFFNFAPGFLTASEKAIDNVATQYSFLSSRQYSGEFGFDLGGPILKDKLWFYVGFAPSMMKYKASSWHSRIIDARNPEAPVFERLDSSMRESRADHRAYAYIAKLSYQPAANHHLSLQVFGAPAEAGGNGRWPASMGDATGPWGNAQDSATLGKVQTDARDVLLKYAGSFWEKKFLVDAHLGWHHQRHSVFPDDDSLLGAASGMSSIPQVMVHDAIEMANLADWGYLTLSELDKARCRAYPGSCFVDSFWFGGRSPTEVTMDRVSAKAMGTFLFQAAGHHVLKAGVSAEFLTMDAIDSTSGGRQLNGWSGWYADSWRYGVLIGPDDFKEDIYSRSQPKSILYGGFIQDSWAIFDKVTLNAGFRWDQQQLYDTNNKLALVIGNQWSPRVGLVYDFMQNGKSKIFANYARLYETVPLHIVERAFPGRRTGGYVYYNDVDCDFANVDVRESFGQCVRPENRFSTAYGAPNPSQYAFAINNQSTLVDTKMKPQSTDEVVAGVEYEVFNNANVGFSYTRRYLNHVVEDMSRDDGYTYLIGNPGFGIAQEFPKAVRNYNGFTVSFSKAFADLWFVQASYTYATLKGNYSGLLKPETEQLSPNATTDFDYLVLTANRSGYLPLDLRHNIRLHATKEFVLSNKMSLALSLLYHGMSGAPTNAYGAYQNNSGETLITPRGSEKRLPWYNAVHAGLKFNIRLANNSVLSIGGTVFNVLNLKTVTGVDEHFTHSNALPSGAKTTEALCFAGDAGCTVDNPNALRGLDDYGNVVVLDRSKKNSNFGRPIRHQAPISARLEARITF